MVDSFGFWVEGTKFLHPQHPTAGRKYHVTVAETDGSRSTVCLCIVTFQSVFQWSDIYANQITVYRRPSSSQIMYTVPIPSVFGRDYRHLTSYTCYISCIHKSLQYNNVQFQTILKAYRTVLFPALVVSVFKLTEVIKIGGGEYYMISSTTQTVVKCQLNSRCHLRQINRCQPPVVRTERTQNNSKLKTPTCVFPLVRGGIKIKVSSNALCTLWKVHYSSQISSLCM